MIVEYLNFDRTRLCPSAGDPVLVVDPDAVLTLAISAECLQAIAKWYSQAVQALGLVEYIEPRD